MLNTTSNTVAQSLNIANVLLSAKWEDVKDDVRGKVFTSDHFAAGWDTIYVNPSSLREAMVKKGMRKLTSPTLLLSSKEAKMAMDVGKIFFDERNIIAYSELGIGRLIYQLPIPLCKMFIKEIFGGKSPDEFDEETLTTINKFFENSLNVSETSRQLFIHRNTLVYRLDKLQKSTRLDIRVFEDAITFRIALMVVKYMNYMENMEY